HQHERGRAQRKPPPPERKRNRHRREQDERLHPNPPSERYQMDSEDVMKRSRVHSIAGGPQSRNPAPRLDGARFYSAPPPINRHPARRPAAGRLRDAAVRKPAALRRIPPPIT